MTFITWACLRCVQELATISGPQNPTQRSCELSYLDDLSPEVVCYCAWSPASPSLSSPGHLNLPPRHHPESWSWPRNTIKLIQVKVHGCPIIATPRPRIVKMARCFTLSPSIVPVSGANFNRHAPASHFYFQDVDTNNNNYPDRDNENCNEKPSRTKFWFWCGDSTNYRCPVGCCETLTFV